MNRDRRSKLILAAACASLAMACTHRIASAQPTATAPGPVSVPTIKNAKVLPADMPRERLFAVMKNISQSLGVRCTHCHVGEEGKPMSTFDFASDAKAQKEIARTMMRMTRRINEEEFRISDMSAAKVTCFTCHRGAAKPLPTVPATPSAT